MVVDAAVEELVPSVVRAAVECGAHFCGISAVRDTKDEKLTMVLSGPAKTTALTVIIGFVIQLGISNLMAGHAASRLDEVEQLLLSFPFISPRLAGTGGSGT